MSKFRERLRSSAFCTLDQMECYHVTILGHLAALVLLGLVHWTPDPS